MTGPTGASGGTGEAGSTRAMRSYGPDRSLRRSGPGGRLVLGGSPVRLLRLTPAGAQVLDRALGPGVDPTPATADLLDRLADAGAIHPTPLLGGVDAPDASEVTVVVPVRDDADGLGSLLTSLAHSDPRPARAVVVDDASDDAAGIGRVVADAARGGLEVDLLRRTACGGPGAARDTGAASVRTPLVAFLDADCTVTAGWLTPLLAHLADPRVGLVAPRVRAVTGPGVVDRYESARSPLDLGPEPARVAPGTRVSYVPSAALVVRAEVFAELDGFDPALRVGEDVDLVWRLVAAGHRARYEPAGEVRHAVRPGVGAWLGQRVGYGTSAAALARRHGGAVAPVVVSPWSAAVWVLVVAGRPAAAAALAVSTTVRLRARLASPGGDELPGAETARLGMLGHLGAGEQLARAIVRVWWPAAIAAAVLSRRARRVVVVSVAVTGMLAARRAHPSGAGEERPAAPVVGVLAVVDDAAYGAGVWLGCWRERSLRALAPRLSGSAGRPDGSPAPGPPRSRRWSAGPRR